MFLLIFNREDLNKITKAYMKTVQWNLAYYFCGMPSWDWYYPYNYAPFASDLLQVPDFSANFVVGDPVSPITHLLAILPSQNGDHLLPVALHGITHGELKAYYPAQCQIDQDEGRPDWQAIALLPFVSKVRKYSAVCSDSIYE